MREVSYRHEQVRCACPYQHIKQIDGRRFESIYKREKGRIEGTILPYGPCCNDALIVCDNIGE